MDSPALNETSSVPGGLVAPPKYAWQSQVWSRGPSICILSGRRCACFFLSHPLRLPPCLHLLEPALIVCSGMTVLPVLIMTTRDTAGDRRERAGRGGGAGDVSLGVSSNICCVWRGEAREGEANVHTRWVRRCGREQRDEACTGGRGRARVGDRVWARAASGPPERVCALRSACSAPFLRSNDLNPPPPKNSGWSAAEWAPNLKQRRTLAS